MILLKLALKSIKNRIGSALLTVVSISLSVALIFAVERIKRAAEESFTQSVSQVDLVVGAKTSPLNLLLFTVFNMGSFSNNVSWKSYNEIKSKPEVAWTIPYSLGDGHRGFRVIGTDENFYEHYRYRGDKKVEFLEGKPALDVWDVVIGSEVHKQLKYKMGDPIVVDHGVTKTIGVQRHDDKPFRISGIMKPTGTAIDQSLYISLHGMEAMHSEWGSGGLKNESKDTHDHHHDHHHGHDEHHDHGEEELQVKSITSFFLRTQNRVETLQLQREINEFSKEPLLAAIPGVTLAELWRGLSQLGYALSFISVMVLIVGLAAMVSTLLSGLNERRREMAILRSIGAGPSKILLLLVLESSVLTIGGVFLGLVIEIFGFSILSHWLEAQFDFSIAGSMFTSTEIFYVMAIIICGSLVGLIPAWKAMRLALKDGLALKV